MKTDRVTLLISPAEKATLAAKAEDLGITISELMRQSALAYDPEFETDLNELSLLTAELKSALGHLQPKLDLAFAESALTRAHIEGRDKDVEAAIATLMADRTIDWSGIKSLFGLHAFNAENVVGNFAQLVVEIVGKRMESNPSEELAELIDRVNSAAARVQESYEYEAPTRRGRVVREKRAAA